ncbi:MAG: VWA domain-containing protein [Lachnospiraceae bacterium]|nr:VWA domain-containing protein [Lachnospiraceae bacterium]
MMFSAAVCTEECDAEAVSGGATQSVSNGNTGYIGVTQDVDWNTENYNAVKESGFVSVNTQPFSTFGADVDTAVYSNFRRSVYENDGFGISGDAIRIEEMVNYFNYDYAKPADGEKFGVVTDLAPCPWNDDTLLLRVGVRAEEIAPEKGSNIVFLIDTSGSMFDNNKLPLAQEAFKTLQAQLTQNDTVSIVTYAGSSEVALEGARGDEHQKIVDAIDELEAYGSTNGEGGIKKAYEIAEKYFIEGGNNRVILATDGDLNVGVSSEAGLIELVEEERETGVFLSCLGFGSGNYQDDKMEALADHGNGNYAFVDCTAEAERVLKDEMWSTLFTVAKDVKFQVEFNPAQVKGYRLVGYENRKMAAEDFADDTKDGGEVGSDQCVTVLYEVVLNDSAFEIPGVDSRYGNDAAGAADSDELLAVNIRYKEPDSNTSELRTYPVTKDMISDTMDDDTSWAAGVAQFGMLLRESEFAGTSTYEDIIDRLKQDPKVMTDDFRAEFLYIAEKVAQDN